MNHGSLFSGIGGFDLASEWMGWENVFHCEIADFPRKVLSYYWPNATSHENIKTTDFTIYQGRIDILTGGFPCQPYSQAGKRLGKEDDRHLWPEMLRAIQEISPRWIVGENVRGLTNWNGGLVFDEVQADLEAAGYEVTPFLLPACAVNAPHRRDRVWFIAYAERSRVKCRPGYIRVQPKTKRQSEQAKTHCAFSENWPTPDPEPPRRERPDLTTRAIRPEQGTWDNWPTVEPTIRSGNDGVPDRLDRITFPKWRNESIKAYGNAIVPQVALQIFKAIEAYESQIK